MKSLPRMAVLCLCAALRAQTPESQPAHLPGEPHHHLKIENAYVRAYYVEVAPHDSTQLHQHDLDYIYVILGPADIINAVAGKPELHQVLRDGEVHFTRGGFAHVARNLSDAPFRNITIEFLHPQGEARNLCGQVAPGPQGQCEHSQALAVGTSISLFRTDEAYLHLFTLNAHSAFTLKNPTYTSLLVPLGPGECNVKIGKGRPRKLSLGDVSWLPMNESVTFDGAGGGTPRFLLLAFQEGTAPNRN